MELFNVYQFFTTSNYETVKVNVDAKTATDTFINLTQSVGSKIGTTTRVVITDSDDNINAEWLFGKGLVYPITDYGYMFE